jgi:hypothetical protein
MGEKGELIEEEVSYFRGGKPDYLRGYRMFKKQIPAYPFPAY